MKTITYIVFTSFLLLTLNCKNREVVKNEMSETIYGRQSIDLFTLCPKDSSNIAFVSLSDIYPLHNEDSDTLALPDIKEKGIDSAQYFILEGKYRKRFLSGTKISETDSVFVYDYSKNNLVSFLVKDLKVAAIINVYVSSDDWPYLPYYYMIGFEIDKKNLNGFSDYYSNALVYVGKENPFSREGLTPMVWKKIPVKEYPSKVMKNEDAAYFQNLTKGNTYLYQKDSLHYFLQDYLDGNNQVYARRLLVLEAKTKNIIIEKNFFSSEGLSPSPLNYEDGIIDQWTGKLFKDKPPVVLGIKN